MAAATAATMATPPAMMQGGAAAAGQLAFSQSSYLGLQLPTNSSPLHFTSFNSKSNRNVQLRCQAAAPSSRTTLPQLNVDITGVWILLLSTNLHRAMPLQRFCMPLWISLCPSVLVCTFSFRVFGLSLHRLLRGVCTCHFSCSEVHKNWEMYTKTMSSGIWWWVMEMGTKKTMSLGISWWEMEMEMTQYGKLWALGSDDGNWKWGLFRSEEGGAHCGANYCATGTAKQRANGWRHACAS